MVKTYSEMYPQGQVQVIISAPSPKSERRTLDGKGFEWEVTGDAQNSKIFFNPRS